MTTVKVDNSYMERLEEVLFDDKNAINFKGVSVLLGVHVNIAKQMLYHFYKTQKEKGKSIYATYFVSGMLPRKMLFEFGGESLGSSSSSTQSESSISEELDAFLVLICRDKDLERYKGKFTKIFSVHIYSLSAFPLENYNRLEALVQQRLRDSEGRTPVDFGPITCSAGLKLRKHIRAPPPPVVQQQQPPAQNSVSKEKKESVQGEPSDKKRKKTEALESKDESSGPAKPEKKAAVVPPKKHDKDRLKNMFASAASKPKVIKEKVNEDETDEKRSKSQPEKSGKSKSSQSEANKKKIKSNADCRKRKRIRDVLSSDSEEDCEDKKSEQDESDSPESPLPKRMQRVIESDSDEEDDFMERPTPKKLESETTAPPHKPGKMHVTKTVNKSYIDKDGYLVTSREKVVVSEDDEPMETDNTSSTEKDKNNTAKAPSPSKNGSNPPTSKKANPPEQKKSQSTTTTAATGKTKQASLMSFFQKK